MRQDTQTSTIELSPSAYLLSAIVDSSEDAIISKDLNGVITTWNRSAQRLFGYTAKEAIGKTVAELLIPDDRQAEEPEILARLRRGERVEHFETVRRCKDGTLLDISLAISPVKDATGNIIGASKIARDISHRKQMEAELRRLNETLDATVRERTRQLRDANEELEAFAYSVSHDLRAPLRSVDGFGRILLRDYAGKVLDERGTHYIERMSAATVRMGRLIEDLLNLSHVSATPLTKHMIDLGSLGRDVWAEIVSQDPGRLISFEIGPNLQACADPALLRIALQNLLANAWKFTGNHPSAKVVLGSVAINGHPTFYISDNGAGFDMGHRDQLFAPFQRLHSGKEFEGSGIGLAIVQRIIHRHGGQIWGEAALSKGATFFFTLPGVSR